jgi:D-alanyl-D-alanine carboxypeptidase
MHPQSPLRRLLILAGFALLLIAPRVACAEALLVVEADTGKVLQAENATMPWYPASVTKLMTTYVTLKAVKEGRITLDTLVTVSPVAAAQSPSKMGFRSGTQVTIDNALKMMMVKSANDMAVVLAEGVGGSVDGFSELMNQNAARLGMSQTHYVNPNGLPADGQVTSARDLAILARAIIRDLPEYEYFVHIPAIRFGKRVTANFNRLIGRYPGADGMKTGFICASGFNLVASATRDGKRLIAVVLGAPSSQARAVRAMQLLEKGFSNNSLTWLRPAMGSVESLAPIDAAPPNLRDEMCGPRRKRPASETDDETVASNGSGSETGATFFASALQAPTLKPTEMLSLPAAAAEPVIVYTGPKKTGADLIAAVAVEEQKQTPKPKGKKARLAARKQEAAEAKDNAKEAAETKSAAKPAKPAGRVAITIDTTAPAPKSDAAKPAKKPAVAKPAASKPAEAKPVAEKPAAETAVAKPKPKPAAKPKAAAKPASDQKSAAAPPG